MRAPRPPGDRPRPLTDDQAEHQGHAAGIRHDGQEVEGPGLTRVALRLIWLEVVSAIRMISTNSIEKCLNGEVAPAILRCGAGIKARRPARRADAG
jgi:hypothetical protein